MALTAQSLTGPLPGIDMAQKINSLSEAQALKQASGAAFIARYISRTLPENSGDLDATEVTNLVNAGFKLIAVQHYSGGTPVYTASLGTQYGNAAAKIASGLGLPSGTRVYVDVESPGAGSDTIAFVQAWVTELKRVAGTLGVSYIGGLYYGAPGMTAAQVQQLQSGGYTSVAWSGCGAPKGNGEQIDQGPCAQTLTGGGYTWSIDRDSLLSGFTVSGFVG